MTLPQPLQPDTFDGPILRTSISLHLLGAITFLLILFLAEVLHRDNIRHHAWRSFCVSWIVFGLSYSVITLALCVRTDGFKVVAGLRERNEEGGYMFLTNSDIGLRSACTIQTGLIYAAPILVANTTLGLIIQLRSIMLHVGMKRTKKPLSQMAKILIVLVPWVLWAVAVISVIVFAFLNPSQVEVNNVGTYCTLRSPTVSRIVAAWLVVIASTVVGIEIYLVVLMYRRGFRMAGQCDASRTAMRIGVFVIHSIVGIGVAVASAVMGRGSTATNIIIAIQSPFAAIIFGTRTSLLCCSTRRKEDKLVKTVDVREHDGSRFRPVSYRSDSASTILIIGFEGERRNGRSSE